MKLLVFWWSVSVVLGASPDPDAMRQTYQTGVKQFNQAQFKGALGSFEKLLPWLQATQKKRKPGTKAWHLMTLGQCDVFHFLGRIAETNKQPRKACLHYREMMRQFKTVPDAWKTWNVNPSLPAHLRKASDRWQNYCPTVPSLLKLTLKPAVATVSIQEGGKWVPVQGRVIKTTKKALRIRISAPGYDTKELSKVPVPRWKTSAKSYELTKTKVVAVVRPPPRREVPVIVPVYKKPWFWVVVGVGVIGTATAVGVGVAYANRGTIIGCENGPINIFGGCGPSGAPTN